MTHKLKTLGVALVAVLALSAMVASAASAKQYTAASYPTTGTATSALGNDVFTTEGGTVECASHFEGTLTAASNTLTVKPTYTGCKAFGFVEAKVEMGNCDYLFTTPTKTATDVYTIQADVRCTSGTIKVIASSCEITIGEQNPGGHVIATLDTNTPATPNDVTVQATVTGINYTVVKDGFLCPFNGTGAKAGGTYSQKAAITFASTNGKSIEISG